MYCYFLKQFVQSSWCKDTKIINTLIKKVFIIIDN